MGKALAGGFPISACVGKSALIERAWPKSRGEAIHTSTFLGHPVGCAMALVNIAEIRSQKLPDKADQRGKELLNLLGQIQVPGLSVQARGAGLMAGLELRQPNGKPSTELTMTAIKSMLQRGYLLLPEGEHGNVIGFTPPLTITQSQLRAAVKQLQIALLPATSPRHRP